MHDVTFEKKVDVALELGAINAQKVRLLECAATVSLPVKVDEGLFQAMKKTHDDEHLLGLRGVKWPGLGAHEVSTFRQLV